jgi:FHS family L-fucose permease-like MFS transporter
VIVLAAIFFFARVPDIKTEDDYHLDDSAPGASHSIWKHPHFVMAVAAQFFYVAAQAGVFSFFINYMTAEVPAIPGSWESAMTKLSIHSGFLQNWLSGWFEANQSGILAISDKGASNLASLGLVCFLVGRFTGAGLLKKFSAHKILGLYGVMNVAATFLVFCKLGWLSVACVFLIYFFMSIMFPTIFALGIFGLGARAKKASAYIVMAIMGGAILPKLMGYVADKFDMSRGFIVPMFCFAFVAFYGFNWPKFAKAESLHGARAGAGH